MEIDSAPDESVVTRDFLNNIQPSPVISLTHKCLDGYVGSRIPAVGTVDLPVKLANADLPSCTYCGQWCPNTRRDLLFRLGLQVSFAERSRCRLKSSDHYLLRNHRALTTNIEPSSSNNSHEWTMRFDRMYKHTAQSNQLNWSVS